MPDDPLCPSWGFQSAVRGIAAATRPPPDPLQVVLSDFFTGGIARMRQTGHTLQSQLHAAGLALKVWQAQKELEAMEK